MSIFTGCFHRDGAPADRGVVGQLAAGMEASGQTDNRFWSSGPLVLGCHESKHHAASHRSAVLAFDSERGLAIAADARVDNRTELASSLRIEMDGTQEVADSRLILAAYARWGHDCARQLLGDFAFVIWDEQQRSLFCARDFIGARPFYFSLAGQSVLFGSQAANLLCHPLVDRELDLPFLAAYFQNGRSYPHPTRTHYAAIQKLAPGHAMTVSAETIDTWPTWDAQAVAEVRYQNEAGYVEHLRSLLDDAVTVRLPAHGPVAAHVSGGLDCSTTAAIAANALRGSDQMIYGSCWSPPPQPGMESQDERLLVSALSQRARLPILYADVTAAEAVAHSLRHPVMEQDSAFIHEVHVREHAIGQGVTTIVSGWGG